MGLDFSHGDAHWSYSGFDRFRSKLAALIGIDWERMDGIARQGPIVCWEDVPTDPILPLLNHSDCEGSISAEECDQIAPRLRELIRLWADDNSDKIQALKLADGMEEAHRSSKRLHFI